MSESYYAVCLTCRKAIYLASASGFYRMHTEFDDRVRLAAFENWLAAHEPIKGSHDVRIVWEQAELPGAEADGNMAVDWAD